MLKFAQLQLDDLKRLRPLILQGKSRICNNTAGGIFMWRDYFSMEYALRNDTVVFKACAKYNGVDTVFSIPLGKDIQGGIEAVVEYCQTVNKPVAFYAVTEDDMDPLRSAIAKILPVTEAETASFTETLHTNEDWSDYIYDAAALVSLAGRKYSPKRNHLNQFKKDHTNWSFEVITTNNLAAVSDFYKEYSSDKTFETKTSIEDHNKTIEVLDNYELYALPGGALLINGNVVAFSIGEIKNEVLHIHVEKADSIYRGIYQVLNNEFAKCFADESIIFINREEDDGDPGLRFSKKSYHPSELVKKYIVIFQ